MEQLIHLNSVDVYNKLYGLETLHPLVSVIDLTQATRIVNHVQMHYGVYALYLKCDTNCNIKYGRKTYDYQEGTIVSFAPGQVVEVHTETDEVQPHVYGILFHPDLIRRTSLGRNIHNFNFFSYSSFEALHLSERERQIILDLLDKIRQELHHGIDKHSQNLIAMNIELLLNYCLRFYERQFITRETETRDVLQKFEHELHHYFEEHRQNESGLPTVKYFADKVFLTPNYFGDLIKKETGKTPQDFIQAKLIDQAKGEIMATDRTISEIAYNLGFQYPQHFTRLFKQQTGITPNQYRIKNC